MVFCGMIYPQKVQLDEQYSSLKSKNAGILVCISKLVNNAYPRSRIMLRWTTICGMVCWATCRTMIMVHLCALAPKTLPNTHTNTITLYGGSQCICMHEQKQNKMLYQLQPVVASFFQSFPPCSKVFWIQVRQWPSPALFFGQQVSLRSCIVIIPWVNNDGWTQAKHLHLYFHLKAPIKKELCCPSDSCHITSRHKNTHLNHGLKHLCRGISSQSSDNYKSLDSSL